MKKVGLIAITCIVLSALAGILQADDKADFEELFGDDYKKVRGTPGAEDDLALAKTMIDLAADLDKRKTLKIMIYEKACELASRSPEGGELISRAVEWLNTAAPDRKGQWQGLMIKIHRNNYLKAAGTARLTAGKTLISELVNAGDACVANGEATKGVDYYREASSIALRIRSSRRVEIAGKMKATSSMMVMERKLKDLQAKVKADPKDKAARQELIKIYLLELDNGIAAAGLVTADVAEPFKTNVPKTAEAIAGLSEADCQLLAKWYQSLAEASTTSIRKAVAFRRMRDYYDAFLVKHAKQDIERLRAKVYRDTAAKKVEGYKTLALPSRRIKKPKVAVAPKPKPETPATPVAPPAKPIASGAYLKSPLFGNKSTKGIKFIDVHPAGILVEIQYDITGGRECITPVYLTKKGIEQGKKYGTGSQPRKLTAKEGYAIGAMIVDANRGMRGGFQAVFMKITATGLNPEEKYLSAWIGKKPKKKVIIGGDGKPIIGIYGRAGTLLDAIGVVQPGKPGAESSSGPGIIESFSFNKSEGLQKNIGENGRVIPQGKKGSGLLFVPGSKADFRIPANLTQGLKQFTFSFWIKTEESGSGSHFHSHPTLLGARTAGGGSGDFGITTKGGLIGLWSGLSKKDSTYQSANTKINDGNWHHIALTNDGVRLILYVDGKPEPLKGQPSGKPLAGAVRLGSAPEIKAENHVQVFHSGIYDELKMYSKALTAAQIGALISRGS